MSIKSARYPIRGRPDYYITMRGVVWSYKRREPRDLSQWRVNWRVVSNLADGQLEPFAARSSTFEIILAFCLAEIGPMAAATPKVDHTHASYDLLEPRVAANLGILPRSGRTSAKVHDDAPIRFKREISVTEEPGQSANQSQCALILFGRVFEDPL